MTGGPIRALALVPPVALLLACGGAASEPRSSSGPAQGPRTAIERDAFASGRHRGVCYAHSMAGGRGYGSPDSEASLRALAGLGVTWVSLTPFGFQRTEKDTVIRWSGSRIAETDERVAGAAAQARRAGMKVMLKPHLWLRPPQWPGSIDPGTDAGWVAWFASYREFILHYARLAETERMDAFCIGNELQHATLRERDWRALVAEVRGVYRGPVTYGATAEEVFGVRFWDALDFIGVSAYFPLVQDRAPSRAALAAAWRPVNARLGELSRRYDRKVVFTEIGYRSADHGAGRHWEIAEGAPVNLAVQEAAYEAFFAAVWKEPWMGGAYFWKWFSHLGHSGPHSNEFEFEGKPAEGVARRHYREGR